MMMTTRIVAAALALGLGYAAAEAAAQSDPRYIRFANSAAKGALYKPDSGPAPKIAVVVIHRTSNFMNHISTTELAARGFLVLGMNPRSDNNESAVDWDANQLDLREAVEFMKKQTGIQKVVLLGHSGGGPTTSYYQAVAENSLAYCKGANKLVECSDRIGGAPKADGLILVDAHPGNSVNGLRSLNPSLTNESDPTKIDDSLNPFDPKNGFNPNGDSTYSAAFQERYYKAQSERMNRLIDKANKLQADMKAGKHVPSDDESFVVYRNRGRLMDISTGVHGSTVKPQKLLKNDGTVDASKPVKTVRVSTPDNAKRDASFEDTRQLTVKSFLGANAVKSTSALDGIDWCSSNNSVPCAVQNISIPLLVTAMGGHYFIRDNEITYDMAKSADKDFFVLEGATHGMTPCKPCASATGQDYGNATKNFFDYLAAWMNKRFS
jgi:pimeloyl-ACP methyl ester carboxylesterase